MFRKSRRQRCPLGPGSRRSVSFDAGVNFALFYDRVTTLRIVRGLQTRGLVARKRSTADGRRLQLTLTAKGVATLIRGRELAAGVTERLMAPLAGNEREQFQGLLRKLCSGLEPQARTKLLPPGC